MYSQITQDERYAIAAMKTHKFSIRRIAAELKRSPSTIPREIRRNRRADGGYRAFTAGEHTRGRRAAGSAWRFSRNSPEDVSGRRRTGYCAPSGTCARALSQADAGYGPQRRSRDHSWEIEVGRTVGWRSRNDRRLRS